jgi:hypothetical protein
MVPNHCRSLQAGTMTSTHVARSVGVVLGLVFGPVILGYVLTPIAPTNDLANFSFGLALFWSSMLLPHLGITRLPGRVPTPGLMLALSLAQWSIVGLLVARLTRKAFLTCSYDCRGEHRRRLVVCSCGYQSARPRGNFRRTVGA